MKNIEYFQQSGLMCDYCDFVDETLEVSQESVGMSCPKCGENLLTQEDFDMNESFIKNINFVNSLSKEDLQTLNQIMGFKQ